METTSQEIIVGLSLSAPSKAALDWAAAQARLTGEALRAVHTVEVPPALANVGIIGSPDLISGDSIDADYRNAITAAWDAVNPDRSWRLELYHGEPGPTLVAQSALASLLVVGTREHAGWSRLVHGSVSHYCLSHAACPVVAVPAESLPAGWAAAAGDAAILTSTSASSR